MHVLIVSSNFQTEQRPQLGGGSAAVAQTLAAFMKSSGHEVSVIRAEDARLPRETVDGIDVFSVAKHNIYSWSDSVGPPPLKRLLWHAIEDNGPLNRGMWTLIREIGPDLIASHNIMGIGGQIWGLAAALNTPAVHTLHDYYLVCPRTTRFSKNKVCRQSCVDCRLLSRKRRAATKSLSGVISVSRHVLDAHLAEGVFADTPDHRVIVNAAAGTGRALPRAAGGRPVRIGFIGRGTIQKGLALLLRAFDEMADRSSHLIIAGGVVPEVHAATVGLRRTADVSWLGHVDRDAFYAAVDVVVVPSLHAEPCPLAISEAQVRGLPLIASRVGGIPEAMGDEKSGWLFPPGDQAALAALLDDVTQQPGQLRSRGSRALSKSRLWTQGRMCKAYEDAYLTAVRDFAPTAA